ncbi:hypothetical protein FF38_05316 [Lucilia cuprina]|uniref:MADF domain-containing protein n=1 Tax=Lucilia cuprina TaxID=7375 RepID=A0A0L0BRM7_LUCCU|nr:hypothetical protein CVS40_4222 [Lucilia cuprina]KNC22676.1 hypothetical protein FF38_05316 [Lucilia cuprina]
MQNLEGFINLIETVKKYPKLFTNTPQNDQDELQEWTAVANECKITISEAQDQWNLLLMEYVEYLRNNQDFSLAQHMDFLQPYFFSINDGEAIDEDELLNAIDCKKIAENIDSDIGDIKNEKEMVRKSIKLQSKDINDKMASTEKLPTTCNQLTSAISSETNNPSNSFTNLSSLELIFLGYAKQLQKMPLQLQLKTKRKIADIMDEAELQMMS